MTLATSSVLHSFVYHFFFFSSRRRHTRCSRDWSSDVCSSDLPSARGDRALGAERRSGGVDKVVTPIPLVDLHAQHEQIADEVQQGFTRVFGRAAFILEEEVAAFEEAFARFSQVGYCVTVGNGTDALELA